MMSEKSVTATDIAIRQAERIQQLEQDKAEMLETMEKVLFWQSSLTLPASVYDKAKALIARMEGK